MLLKLAKDKTEQLYLATFPSALPDVRKGIRINKGLLSPPVSRAFLPEARSPFRGHLDLRHYGRGPITTLPVRWVIIRTAAVISDGGPS